MDGDDDYPEKDTLERLYNAAKEKDCAIVAGYRSLLTEDGINVDVLTDCRHFVMKVRTIVSVFMIPEPKGLRWFP